MRRWNSSTRLLCALMALVLMVVASCSDAEPETTTVPTSDGTVPAAGDNEASATTGSGDDGRPATPTTAAGTGSGSGSGSGSEAPPQTPAPPTEAPSPIIASPPPGAGAVGAFAAFYLRPSESSQLILEFLSQTGAEPRTSTVNHVSSVLERVSGKPVGRVTGAVPGGARSWTAAEIRALADDRGAGQSRDRAVITLLFLQGGFAASDTALGVAVRSDVAAIFPDRVSEAAGVLGDPARIEDAVTVHEVGHLLGLVDLFLDTGRADRDHPGHSPNRGSVMYYAVESTLVGDLLAGGPPTEFDQADLDDLARIRNG